MSEMEVPCPKCGRPTLEMVEEEVERILWDAEAYPTEESVANYARQVTSRLRERIEGGEG